jgi:hypothetical protein
MRRPASDTAQLSLPLEMSGVHVALGSTSENDLAVLTRGRRRPSPTASSEDAPQRTTSSRSNRRLFLSIVTGSVPDELSHQKVLIPIQTGTGEVQSAITDAIGSLPSMEHDYVSRRMTQAFDDGVEEIFESGSESVLSRWITSLIETYEDAAVSSIEELLDSGRANVEVAVEALRQLGKVEHLPTKKYRLSVLQNNLLSQSARIRFGAALGLAAMNDRNAISALEQAFEAESYPRLRRTIRDVLDQLETRGQCPVS